jgi:hypothetical protein
MNITFSTCFYILKSKFDPSKYQEWMNNLISITNNFNLVIYTDENTSKLIQIYNKPNIKIVIKPIESFMTYRFKPNWINNHDKNHMLNHNSQGSFETCWELNMLWSEKVWFVNQTVNQRYFDTEYYGWCDIGYFRNRDEDTHTNYLQNWPSNELINKLEKNKIHYGCICNNYSLLAYIQKLVKNKDITGLPKNPIPPNQQSVGAGFFILHKTMSNWWAITYTEKLHLYLQNNYLVKDDQMIVIDCIFSDINHFKLYQEKNSHMDNWFMFQRLFM